MTELDQLTRAKAWLDSFRPLPNEVTAELRHRFEVRLTYHSTAIEGNTLTQSETQIVIEKGITIGGKSVHDHLEVIGHKEALDFVFLLAAGLEPLGERQIREIHSLVMKGQGHGLHGAYRTLDVMAAGTEFCYPSHLLVHQMMEELIEWLGTSSHLHPIERATEAHVRFVTIHPFADGNGRVGRLLLNLLLIQSGYPIAVLSVEKRSAYIGSLIAAQGGQGSESILQLVCEAVESSLRETIELCVTSASAKEMSSVEILACNAWINEES